MTINSIEHISEKDKVLLEDLQLLLEKQVKLAHKGDMISVESLSVQADSIIATILQRGIPDNKDFKSRLDTLQKLYRRLSVTISAQKAEMGERLSRVRKGKKTVAAYRGNI
jgi:hypothetical protein